MSCLVSAVIKDPSGNIYANAFVEVSFKNPNSVSQLPLANGSVFPTVAVGKADSFGAISFTLTGNDVISPAGTLWTFVIVAVGGAPAWSVDVSISGTSQDITSNIQAAAPPQNTPTSFGNITATSVTSGNINKFRYVDGTRFATIQAAINDLGSPALGTIYIPSGTYTQNSSFTIPAGSSIQFIGEGRGSTIINSNLTTGDLFPFQNMSEWSVRGLTINNTGAGGGRAFHCNYAQRCLIAEFTITGPWADGIYIQGREGVGSAIFIAIRDGLITGPTGSCITYDSTGETNQTVNSNQIMNVTATCGGSSGKALQILGPNFICNENGVYHSQFTAPGGTGVSIANSSARDLLLVGCTLEASAFGFVNGTGNKVILIGCEISANSTTNFTDGSNGSTIVIGGNIGGTIQTFFLDETGLMKVGGLGIGAAPALNNINVANGNGLQASGNQVMIFNTTSLELTKNLIFDTGFGITQYKGIATVGNGANVSFAQDDRTGQSASIGAVTLITGSASSGGHYFFKAELYCTATDASGATVSVTVNWTSEGIARSSTSATIGVNATTQQIVSVVPLNADNSQPITYNTTVTGAPTTGRYAVHVWISKE